MSLFSDDAPSLDAAWAVTRGRHTRTHKRPYPLAVALGGKRRMRPKLNQRLVVPLGCIADDRGRSAPLTVPRCRGKPDG